MKKTLTLSLALSSMLLGAGYQIPNTSINSNALSTAYVANANGADAAYYNPANMVNNEQNAHQVEISVGYVSLDKIHYDPTTGSEIDAKSYSTLLPSFHYSSANLAGDEGDIRIGFSVVVPAGLTREWEDAPAIYTAKKYALRTLELNPSLGVKVNEKLSFGLGLRYVRGIGELELGSNASTLKVSNATGDGLGFNAALAYKPIDGLNISTTYRSAVGMTLKGDASGLMAAAYHSSKVSMDVHMPANLIIATAYTLPTNTTVEVTYDKVYWSVVTNSDLNFGTATFTKTSKLKDSESYRIGLTQKYDAATMMAGFAYNKNNAPEEYVSFSGPDVDTLTFSLGGRYDVSESINVGLAALYNKGQKRDVSNTTVNGEISNKDAMIVSLGANFKF